MLGISRGIGEAVEDAKKRQNTAGDTIAYVARES